MEKTKKDFFCLNEKKPLQQYLFVFTVSLIIALIIFLPYVILDGGYFNYIGDFNVQQIPFYTEANESVRNGELMWNNTTGLGVSLIGSYAFYLIGSPFFWLTLLLPLKWVPASIPFLISIKSAVAATTSFGYLKRVVKNKNYAFIGSLLYAFSGFCLYNVFFNHFHDIIAFFPLMLTGLEKLLDEGKPGYVAFAVFINALTNYYFFVAEVVFVVIYFFVGFFCKKWKNLSLKRFGMLAFESVLGFLMAAVIVLPAVLATLQIDRANEKLSGWHLLVYSEPQRPLQLIEGLFFPPEVCSITNMLPDAGAKWGSVNAWLPVFGTAGTLAYLGQRKKRDFYSYMVIIPVIMLFVPVLNASFQLFSYNFYTRWLFALVLMMSAVTIKALEDLSFKEWMWGAVKSAIVILGLALPIMLIKNPETEKLGLCGDVPELISQTGMAFAGIIVGMLGVYALKMGKKKAMAILCSFSIAFVAIFGCYYVGLSKMHGHINDDDAFTNNYVLGRWNMKTKLNDGERIDAVNCETNAPLFWNMPSQRIFHSIVTGSEFEFYDCIGISRGVKSDADYRNYALKSLFSVRYMFDGKDETPMYTNFKKLGKDGNFNLYEYNNYIPMGFGYEKYITRTELEETFQTNLRDDIMLDVLVVEDEDELKVSDILRHAVPDKLYSEINLTENSLARKEDSCTGFKYGKNSFNASYTGDRENVIFFSVPYDSGWSAKVNGKDAQILKTNVGFMAVRTEKGANEIEFRYETPGLKIGAAVSAAAIVLFAAYAVCGTVLYKKNKDKIS